MEKTPFVRKKLRLHIAIGRKQAVGDFNLIGFFELCCWEHVDRVPCHLTAYTRADLTTNAFVKTNLNWRNGNIVFLNRNRFNAIYRTKWNTDLTARAVILITGSHHFGLFFLLCDFCRKGGDGFIVIVGCHINSLTCETLLVIT